MRLSPSEKPATPYVFLGHLSLEVARKGGGEQSGEQSAGHGRALTSEHLHQTNGGVTKHHQTT